MVSKKSKKQNDPAYLREQGKRDAVKKSKRFLTFSFSKHIRGEGQSIEEWGKLELLGLLVLRLKNLGQYSTIEVRQKGWIKEYHKVNFPPNSKFSEPKHVINVTWAVLHITPTSKEVVVGYIENDIFYIVFLDKDHEFWPSKMKNT